MLFAKRTCICKLFAPANAMFGGYKSRSHKINIKTFLETVATLKVSIVLPPTKNYGTKRANID